MPFLQWDFLVYFKMKKQQTNNRLSVDIAGMAKDVSYLRLDVTEIKQRLEADYVTQDQFAPVQKIVYGMVTTILLAVVGVNWITIEAVLEVF